MPAVFEMTSLLIPLLLTSSKFSKHVEAIDALMPPPYCASSLINTLDHYNADPNLEFIRGVFKRKVHSILRIPLNCGTLHRGTTKVNT